MTPAARVQTAIEILDEVFAGAPAEKALTGWARRSRFAGSKDRAAVRDHVFAALRCRNTAAAIGGGVSGRSVMVGLMQLEGADLDALFTGTAYGPEALSDQERLAGASDGVLDIPDWLDAPLRQKLGDRFEATLDALRQRAPIFLRVNPRKATAENVISDLREDGIEAIACALAPTALEVVSGARRVAQSAAYKEGRVEMQDAASQAAVAMLALKDGDRVLDYCAGGGGKVLAMAAQVDGAFYAYDVAAQRMRDIPSRAVRAGVQIDVLSDPAQNAPYDLVFCDAPCSGSGTWRRTPDAKWRFTPEKLAELIELQGQILRKASGLVSEGGELVYATCSLLDAENEDQIERFISDLPDWSLVQSRQFTFDDGGDGFFLARLTRRSTVD